MILVTKYTLLYNFLISISERSRFFRTKAKGAVSQKVFLCKYIPKDNKKMIKLFNVPEKDKTDFLARIHFLVVNMLTLF